MRFIFCALMIVFSMNCTMGEPLKIFISKVKVASKNNGKDWDTFKGAPDIQISVFKHQNNEWKKTFLSKVYTNHYIVEDVVVVEGEYGLNDQIMVEIVDRDFRNNDTIGRQIFTLDENDLEDTTSFSMVEEFTYIITRYSSLEERNKAIENAKWLELEKKKELEEKRRLKEVNKWEKQKEQEKKLLEKELDKAKEDMLVEFIADLENKKKVAEMEIAAQKKEAIAEMTKKIQEAEKDIAKKEKQLESEIKQQKEKVALENLLAKQQIEKEIKELSAKKQKMMADLEYENAQNSKKWQTEHAVLQEKWQKEYKSLQEKWQNEHIALKEKWQNEHDAERKKWDAEKADWEQKLKTKKEAQTENFAADEKKHQLKLDQMKENLAKEVDAWKEKEKNKAKLEINEWQKKKKDVIEEELANWEKNEKNKILEKLAKWEEEQRALMEGKLSEKKETAILFKGVEPKKMTAEEVARAMRALELTFRSLDSSGGEDSGRIIEDVYESFVGGIRSFTKGYKMLEKMAKGQ